MNPTQAWSLLTARAASDCQPRGYGSLTSEDIRAMLGGLEERYMLSGMCYHFDDPQAMDRLERILWDWVCDFADKDDWAKDLDRGQQQCRRLAGIAMYEVFSHKRCPECNGIGNKTFVLHASPTLILSQSFEPISAKDGKVQCVVCFGGGKIKMSARRRADLGGFARTTWARRWSKRYEVIHSTLAGWLSEAHSHLARNLKKNNQAA